MNRKFLGGIFLLTGICKFSAEIYFLKVLQCLEIEAYSSGYGSPWRYFGMSTVIVPFLITVGILIAGLVLIFGDGGKAEQNP